MRVTIGIDVGGTKVLGVAVAPGGDVVAEARRPTPRAGAVLGGLLDTLSAMVAELDEAGRRVGSDAQRRPAVGLGLPGLVDEAGTLIFAPHLPAALGTAIGTVLAERVGGRVVADNDATCATYGEWQIGAAKGAADAVVLTLGTGIGAGLVVGGRLVRGAHGFAGEVGHVVFDPAGPPCPCGRQGCWERYASGAGTERLARQAAAAGRLPTALDLAGGDLDSLRGEHVTAASRTGEPGALAVLADVGTWLGAGLANLVALLDPEVVVVGGGLADAGDALLDPARRALAERVPGGPDRPPVALRPAALGERAGAIGAALLSAAGPPTPRIEAS